MANKTVSTVGGITVAAGSELRCVSSFDTRAGNLSSKGCLIKCFGDFFPSGHAPFAAVPTRWKKSLLLDSHCPTPAGRVGRMNIKRLFSFGLVSEQIVAVFGHAQLVKRANGRHELIGGTAADHIAAREWCSFFCHELVFTSGPLEECSETAFAE